jgi:hypothetical protein
VDAGVPPFLILGPSLINPSPLLLPLVFSQKLNLPLKEATYLLLGSDLTFIESIFSENNKNEEENSLRWGIPTITKFFFQYREQISLKTSLAICFFYREITRVKIKEKKELRVIRVINKIIFHHHC